MVTLTPMSDEEIARWAPVMFADYVEQRVSSGEDRAVALATSAAQQAQLFPSGSPAEGQHVLHVVHEGADVGVLWMGRPLQGGDATWYVFYVEIDEAHRGQGLGRGAMEAAETWTAEHGGTRVGLNVFGQNLVARSLYDSLGYQVMATAMYKDL